MYYSIAFSTWHGIMISKSTCISPGFPSRVRALIPNSEKLGLWCRNYTSADKQGVGVCIHNHLQVKNGPWCLPGAWVYVQHRADAPKTCKNYFSAKGHFPSLGSPRRLSQQPPKVAQAHSTEIASQIEILAPPR